MKHDEQLAAHRAFCLSEIVRLWRIPDRLLTCPPHFSGHTFSTATEWPIESDVTVMVPYKERVTSLVCVPEAALDSAE